MNKLMVDVASWPALAASDGKLFSFIALGFRLVCHPCHLFQESVMKSNANELSEFNGKGGIPTVHGVLGKIKFPCPSDPLIKVLTNV
jgi:hypothetical protein